jgi:hypothetical protein
MHPLNLLSPSFWMTLYVTNNGYWSAVAAFSLRSFLSGENKLLRLELLLVALLASLALLGVEIGLCRDDELSDEGV